MFLFCKIMGGSSICSSISSSAWPFLAAIPCKTPTSIMHTIMELLS